MRLGELIDVGGTANWRRLKAEEYPNDDRNVEAADLLGRLANNSPNLDGSEVHRRIETAYFADATPGRFSEVVSEELRNVGFHSWPESGRDLLEGIANRLVFRC
jgi:hypothetical protein